MPEDDKNQQSPLCGVRLISRSDFGCLHKVEQPQHPRKYPFIDLEWQLMEALVRAVKEIHSKEYVVIGLNPENIYLRGKQGILIGDWSLSKNMAIN